MSAEFFLDTNILVYCFDSRDCAKQEGARELVSRALKGEGLISSQVVQEFLNVALRKFRSPMSSDQAQRYLESVLLPLCRIYTGPAIFHRALGVRFRWGFSFYDAMVVAAAQQSGCKTLLTEDLQHGQECDGLSIKDPFKG